MTDHRPSDESAPFAADEPASRTPRASGREPLPPRSTRMLRWLVLAVASIILAVAALTLFGAFFLRPDCDSSRVKTYFSNLFNVDATAFGTLATIAKTDEAYDCVAHLSLRDGRKLQVNYRLTGIGRGAKIQITGTAFGK